MISDQTISVSRELLERIADEANHMLGFTYAANYDECRSAVDELRALLDSPAIAICRGCFTEQSMGHACKTCAEVEAQPAAQPQGEPVAWIVTDMNGDNYFAYDRQTPNDKPLYAEQPAPVAAAPNYGSLDAVQRLALCRGDVLPTSAAPAEPDRIKGMVETIGGQYAVMIDPENGHYGWTFKKHPDGQWVSGRKATEREMIAARSHAQITNQL